VFARAVRPDVESSAAAGEPTAEPPTRRTGRSPQLIAIMLATVCVSACQETTVSGLNVRAAPTTHSAVVAKMSRAGTAVYIDCYTRGQSIYGQTIWYRITQPHRGYVTAYYVNADSGDVGAHRAC
jgi:3D (Asp-Asp-Asp) domain-containing protein